MRILLTSALAASTVAAMSLSACAPAATRAAAAADGEKSVARCFRTDSVRNFRTDRQSDLYIRSLRDDVFQINTSGACWDLDSAVSIAVTPTLGGSDTVCVGDPVQIIVPNADPGRRTCRAFVTKSLTAEEVAALPDRARP
ncbi:MAG: hypothetical protein B7Y85_09535 [Brevundimonas sp. 32-68-21]|jgi:hypothetical protein|uniref:Lipoprotein n=1 Tax=Brevundimonas mediterranea TaxID=74329 RepID=A0AB37E8M8_9CAUL|nr:MULTISPECIES: DUF6491 family protein [Brevundimonas]OGN46653.1 MAG: hypothetical protein A3E24_12370 [Caulobacterales bacterium RIFCSPHIGHO2_12_FULL_68_13]OYX79265.1 MAG: hypothetical protein B7Y85_09535 [Brevundimonas sp. 32-68-21]EDX79317.1 hypothetical protein BBAL3_474 [Brevundimonas sp. BAL3]MBA4332866.1 hypothetical protein [Brevundimonas sp.]QIH73663.1 hypothetical protein GYM46_12315 [Brevundimonas mediterranea]